MNHIIDSRGLTLTVNAEEREYLRGLKAEDPDKFMADSTLYDILEWMTTNAEFTWIGAEYTGDLTDAPMLAILGEEETGDFDGFYYYGSGYYQLGSNSRAKILGRWAYMNYAVDCCQDELLRKGTCTWAGGAVMAETEEELFV